MAFDELRRYFDSHALEWKAAAEQEQKSTLRTFLSHRSRQAASIKLLLADYGGEVIDLLFVVEGDLYDGESAAIPIFHDLLSAFPQIALDFMVLPLSRYTSEFRWGSAPEVLFSRQ